METTTQTNKISEITLTTKAEQETKLVNEVENNEMETVNLKKYKLHFNSPRFETGTILPDLITKQINYHSKTGKDFGATIVNWQFKLTNLKNQFDAIQLVHDNRDMQFILDMKPNYDIVYGVFYRKNIKMHRITLHTFFNGENQSLSVVNRSKIKAKNIMSSRFVNNILTLLQFHLDNYDRPDAQMEKDEALETVSGTAGAVGDKDSNAIMTRDTTLTTNDSVSKLRRTIIPRMCNSEESASFPIWQKRFISIKELQFSTKDEPGSVIYKMVLPRDLYEKKNTPNVRPYSQFGLNRSNFKVEIKTNSNKFDAGRYLVSYIYDPLSAIPDFNDHRSWQSVQCASQRGHAIIDLAQSNEAELEIPYVSKSPFTTSLPSVEKYYAGAATVAIIINCISPLTVGTGASTTVPVNIYISTPGTQFIGMRYEVTPTADAQGPIYDLFKDVSKGLINGLASIPVLGTFVNTTGNVLGKTALAVESLFLKPEAVARIEKDLRYIGIINNRDKPRDPNAPKPLIPDATGPLAVGTNVVENMRYMGLDPTITCVHLDDHEIGKPIRSLKDLLRVWQYQDSFKLSQSDKSGKQLYTLIPAPGYMVKENRDAQFCNLFQILSQYYTYYSGTIEIMLVVVGTDYHRVTLKAVFIPYRDRYDYEEANSGYVKILDIREQRSYTFTVPYISPTVQRCVQGTPFMYTGYDKPSIGSFKVFVENPLTPIQSVATTIDVLVYVRAGPDFTFSYPRPAHRGMLDMPRVKRIGFGIQHPTLSQADAQMERGEDQDVDQTPDFGGLIPGGSLIQTFENHMDVKNILRRWIFKETLEPNDEGFIVSPVTLPFFTSDIYPIVSLSAYILRNARFYRGSMNYMFVFKGENKNNSVIRVTHVPQDSMLAVTEDWTKTLSKNERYLFGGYAAELVVPAVNPVAKFNIPMHGVFDYLDSQFCTFTNQLGSKGGWKDATASNLGHLIISEAKGFTVDVYWSMGDDAEIYCWNPSGWAQLIHFPAPEPSTKYTIDTQREKGEDAQGEDEFADAQAPEDEDNTEVNDPIMSQYTGSTNATLPPPTRFFSLSGFGRRAYDRVYDSIVSATRPVVNVGNTMAELPSIASSLKNTIHRVDDAMDYLREMATNMVNGIKKSCTWLTSCGTIFSCILHFLQVVVNPTWKAFAIAIVGVVTSLGCFTADFGSKLLNYFLGLKIGRSAEEQPTAEQADAQCRHSECNICTDECRTNCRVCQNDGRIFDDNTIGSLVGLVFASVSAMLGYSGEKPETKFFTKLFNFNKNFWTTIRGATSFLSSMVTLIKRIFNYCAKRVGAAAATRSLVQSATTQALESFIKEATYMIDERNIQQINSNPTFKYRFWYTVSAAYQHLARLTAAAVPNTSALSRLCYKVIEQGNKLAIQSMACPVRYEPFVLSVEGDSKLGKSFMLQDMLPQLLRSEAYNLVTYDSPVYVRTPGVEFWNGFRNQPCILYDDYLAVNIPEVAVAQVVELYNLKSSALFNVNMAHLETKEMVGNPFIVALATNSAFTVLNGTVCPEAFLRRKEHLWKVSLVDKYKGYAIPDIPEEDRNEFKHLQFQRYMDPADHKSLSDKKIGYAEWYATLVADCKVYHEREKRNVKRRMERLTALLPETASAMMAEVDPFNIFYGAYHKAADGVPTQSGLLPSQLVDEQLQMTTRAMRLEAEARNGNPQPPILDMTREDHRQLTQQNDLANLEPLPEIPPGTGIPDAQSPLSWLCPEELREWFGRVKRRILPQPPELEDMEHGQCSVCMEETYLPFTCAGRHNLCEACNRGMRLASQDVDGPAYRCGVCRQDIIDIRLTPEYWTHAQGTIYWLYIGYNRMTRTGRKLIEKIKYILSTKAFHMVLTIGLTVAYGSLMSWFRAQETFRRSHYLYYTHNLWRDRDDYFLVSVVKRWGPFFYNVDEYVDYDTYIGNAQSGDDDLVPITDEEYAREQIASTSSGFEMEPEDLTVDRPEWNWLTKRASKDLLQYIPNLPERPTADIRCRHLNLLRLPLAQISYERDNNNIGWWCLESGGRVYDGPCHHDDCPFKDSQSRHNFLNNWALDKPVTIDLIRRSYDPNRGILSWQLPQEYMTVQCQAAISEVQQELQEVVSNIRRQSWTERLGGAWQSIKRCIKVLGMILLGLGSLVAAVSLVKHMIRPSVQIDNSPNAQVVSSGSMVTRHIQRRVFKPRVTGNIPEAQIRQDIEDRAIKLIERNTIFLKLTREGYREDKLLRGIGLFGRIALFPGHFGKLILSAFKKDPKGTKLEVQQFMHRDCVSTVTITEDLFVFSENDFCYMRTPHDFPLFKDITNQVPTVEQHTHIGGNYLHIECVDKKQMINAVPGVIQGNIDRQAIRGTTNWAPYEIFDVYLTTYGKDGSCGAILVSDCNTPLFAMHVAGHNNNPLNNTGYAIPLIREDIEALKEGHATLSYWRPNLKKAVDAQMSLPGCINPVGAVRRQDVAYMPKVTKIIPSNLQGVLTDFDGSTLKAETQPGILHSADERYKFDKSPLYYGCLKHTLPPKKFEEKLLEQCVEEVKCEFRASMVPMRDITTPLTYEQAISGFSDLEYYDSIDLSTSAGWPWNTQERKIKNEYIQIIRDKHSVVTQVTIDKDLIKVMDRNQGLRREGIRPFTVFLDWLKDERRKHKKLVLADGTRVFSLSPMDLTIQMRQRFLDFAASFMHNRELLQHAVGISTDGPEWSRLANGLLANSDKIVTGDYSDFGPRLASQLVRAAFEIIIDWYKHNGIADSAILREMQVMSEEVSNAYHIMHDFVYETMCGIPSGNILTVIINSIVNMLYIRYVWYTIFPKSTHQEYRSKVFLKTYGDDMIMSVKDDVIEKFNCRTISEVLKQYDIAFTDAEKTGTKEYDTIYKSTFLKSGFVRHPYLPDQWLAPLEELSIKECALWIWKSPDNEKATIANAEQSLRLAYGRGEQYFKKWKAQLNRALTELRYPNLPITWHQVDRLFFNEEVLQGEYEKCSQFSLASGDYKEIKKNNVGEASTKIQRLLLDESPEAIITNIHDKTDCV